MTKDISDVFWDFNEDYLEELEKRGLKAAGWGTLDSGEEGIVVDLPEGTSINDLPTKYKKFPIQYNIGTKYD